jgi:hypothetical protein
VQNTVESQMNAPESRDMAASTLADMFEAAGTTTAGMPAAAIDALPAVVTDEEEEASEMMRSLPACVLPVVPPRGWVIRSIHHCLASLIIAPSFVAHAFV